MQAISLARIGYRAFIFNDVQSEGLERDDFLMNSRIFERKYGFENTVSNSCANRLRSPFWHSLNSFVDNIGHKNIGLKKPN